MAVERLIQKLRFGDRQFIQESLSKFIRLIAEDKKNQEEVFKNFSEEDIIKIMTYLEDTNSYMRKLTAKFFLDLVYDNYAIQQVFCDALGILPCDGKICLNKVPEAFKGTAKSLPECLELLKKAFPEENKENLPYCWYYTVENADQSDKQIDFISSEERRGFYDVNGFIDPLYSMIGFIVRTPKVRKPIERKEEPERSSYHSKINDFKRPATTSTNNRAVTSTNSSLDQSIITRIMNVSSKSPEREILKTLSPVRGYTVGNTLMSSRLSSGRNTKVKIETVMTEASCTSERNAKQKIGASSIRTERSEEIGRQSLDRGLKTIIGYSGLRPSQEKRKTLNYTLNFQDKRLSLKGSDRSVDTYEQTTATKTVPSINESSELNSKGYEVSTLSASQPKGITFLRSNDKSPDISRYRVSANIEKRVSVKKVNEKQEKINSLRSKPFDLDKKLNSRNIKDNTSSISASTTPKNNLLSKLLKEKPVVRDHLYSNKYKAKQETSKKLNSTVTPTGSSSISSIGSKHISQKLSLIAQKGKGSKAEGEYSSKKTAFNSALLKSIDVSNQSSGMIHEDAIKENIQGHGERAQTAGKGVTHKYRTHVSPMFKPFITTPRSPNESLKATLSSNTRILNARGSQDVFYQYKDRRKTEVTVPLQNVKNRTIEIGDNGVELSLDNVYSTTTPKSYLK